MAQYKIEVANRGAGINWDVPLGGLRLYLAYKYLLLKTPVFTDSGEKVSNSKLVLYFTDKKRMNCPLYGLDQYLAMGMGIYNIDNISTAVYVYTGTQVTENDIPQYIVTCMKEAEKSIMSNDTSGDEVGNIFMKFLNTPKIRRGI
ncbi:MAG: hypothetical protein HY864_15670 [Chloroflexi bacterium]|nr:hypothetical protein [Chloroflexota bacterium]